MANGVASAMAMAAWTSMCEVMVDRGGVSNQWAIVAGGVVAAVVNEVAINGP